MQPELTPEEIEQASFTIGLRGYDKQEVESFLADVADQLRGLRDMSANTYVDLGEEMGELLQHARDTADEMTRKAEEKATALRAQVDVEANDKRRATDEYVKSTQDNIGDEIKSMREGAEEQARAIIADAQQRIVTLQQEESEARERIRALRLQLLEVTLRLQRFEVADDGAEPDDEPVEEFRPAPAGPADIAGAATPRPAGDADAPPSPPAEAANEDLAADDASRHESVEFPTQPVNVIELDDREERAQEQSR